MLEIRWEWIAAAVLTLLLIGYAVYQRRCWLCDDDQDTTEEKRDERHRQ